MKARRFAATVVCYGLLMAAMVLLAQAQGMSPADQNVMAQEGLGTGFTYQGRLLQGGNPLNGTCDLQFSLWDAVAGGTQVGITQTKTAATVSDGGFTVVLDFGAAPFGGDARWLEVSVRSPAGSGSYTTLSPRQPLTAVPYALYARNAWSLTGNAGTTPGTQFLGTTDDRALELKVNGARALRLEPVITSPNVIGGHSANIVTAGAAGATIGGGGGNGLANTVSSDYGTTGGGAANSAGGYAATVGGGFDNTADGTGATVGGGGGYYRRDLSQPEMPSSGIGNTAGGQWATVAGGAGNRASAYGDSIGGGGGVWYDRFGVATLVGNRTEAMWSTVGGGVGNVATGLGATVAGGGLSDFNFGGYYARLNPSLIGNKAQGGASTVGGGMNNLAGGTHATVAGGSANSAIGYGAVVGGGGGFVEWDDPGQHAYVLDPIGNAATGDWATVPGGRQNTAAGDYSLAAGRRARATEDGSFVWADSTDADFGSGAQNQFAVRATGGVSIEIGNGISLNITPNISETVGGMRIRNLIGGSSAELAVVAGVKGSSLAGSGVSGNSTYGDGVTGTSGKAGGGSFTGLQYGVYGEADPWYPLYPGPWYGVWGKTAQGTWSDMKAIGVKGEGSIGVAGTGDAGIYGAGLSYGGYFTTSAGVGLLGGVSGDHFTGIGVQGESTSPAGTGVYGHATNIDYGGTGVKGVGDSYGVYGESVSGSGGYFKSTSGIGLHAESTGGDLLDLRIPGNRRFYVSNAGNVYADGTYSSPAADLAEMLPAAGGLQPGDVLVVGTDGKLRRSSQPYQTNVVGVYSTRPGFLGGAGDDADLTDQVPLAVIGVVPVKVTAENGPILPGDALTASSTPGHAMKAEMVTIDGISFLPSGMIIGKALEQLDRGAGVIRMLVMLQ